MGKQSDVFKSFQFKPKQFDVFTPELAKYKAENEGINVRRMYSQMREIAQKRLSRLQKAGYGESDIVRYNTGRFPYLREIGPNDKALLYDAISEVSRFLAAKRSTVGGTHEIEHKAEATFLKHYGDEIGDVDWKVFGEMMRSIKDHAMSKSYYRNWKNTYRTIQGNAKRAGLTARQLKKAVDEGKITIGAKGGLYDNERQRYIRGKWDSMGA